MLLLFLNYPSSSTLATTAGNEELTCPVCKNKCEGRVIYSTNSFGGQDRDFLKRAAGAQPFLLTPVTCSKCFYSGYGEDFKIDVSQEMKNKILNEKIIKVPDYKNLYPGRINSDSERIPAWVRYDLITQIMKINNEDNEKLAWQYMNASWAVRFEENPFELKLNEFSEGEKEIINNTVQPLMKKENQNSNRALLEIKIVKILLENILNYPSENHHLIAIYVGHLLRNHGENEFLLSSKQAFMPYFSKEELDTLFNEITISINLERTYQLNALELYKNILNSKVEIKDKAVFTYLTGELYRRLGDYGNAITYFENVKKIDGAPDWLIEYADEQKLLSAEN